MTLGVETIFWFISHTMSCQPKGLRLHIYSWPRQPNICQDASLRCSNEGIQRPSILVVIDIAVPNCLPHVPHLKPYPHHRGPLDVVDLGEGRPPTVGIDVPDNGLDPMVTMVPIRGGRAAPPLKAVISANPATGASAPARSAVDASALIRAAATVPLGVRGCPLHCLLPRCLPR
jgi:hypothetical protein